MRKITGALAVLLGLSLTVSGQIPAFPGAKGFGAYAAGGRGGDVYHVVNLNTSGAGSFADAIATVPASGRTIVFDVSGYINVNKTTLGKNKVTIAGQTAPGDGIGFKGGTFIIGGNDVVIRHARYRYGDQIAGGDCINLNNGVTNLMLDHISMAFSTDENISSFEQDPRPDLLTFQWSLNAWGLESHSCGGLWDLQRATTHHTLWSHNHTRNPKARPDGLLDWINNVTFDWDIGFIMGDSTSPANWKANVLGNYFVCPPGNLHSAALVSANLDRNGNYNFTLHVSTNLFDKNGNTLLDGSDYGFGIASGSYRTSIVPIVVAGAQAPVVVDSPLTAYKKIVSRAGPLRLDALSSLPLRDEVDTILVNNLVTMRRNHVSHESQTGASNNGMGTLNSAAAPVDGDRDGMPNYWEQTLGWNVSGQDHNTVFPSSGGIITGLTFFPPNTPAGYTRLEEYLHFLTIPHATILRNLAGDPSSVTADLRKFTAGFDKAPVAFTFSNVTNGVVALQPDGHTVVFTPTLDFSGRAKFDFTVTDGDGGAWTQTLGVLVSAVDLLSHDLKWKGDGAANAWDIGLTPNWLSQNNSASPFTARDTVTFNDDGSNNVPVALATAVRPAAVTVNATKDYTFAGPGSIAGTSSLLKLGSGTLTLTATNCYFGPTIVSGGTLKLGTGPLPRPAIPGLLYHLDASDPATLTLVSGTNVSSWADAAGGGLSFTQGTVANRPVLVGGALNGRPVIRFSGAQKLVLTTATAPREIIAMVTVKGGADGNIGGFLGINGADTGLRLNSSPGSWASDGASTLVNGVLTTTYLGDTPHVVHRYGTSWTSWPVAGLGQYYSGGGRYFNGDVAEVLVFGNALSAADRASVRAYLNSKWLGTGALPVAALPANTAVSLVACDAALDLGGANQILGSLAGAEGSRVTNNGFLTVGADDSSTTFSGTISGAGGLGKTGAGTFTLRGAQTYAGPTLIEAGKLKLGAASLPRPAIAGLLYHLDACAPGTLTLVNGTNVSAWTDAAGGGLSFTQGTVANRPALIGNALNGNPVIRFSGAQKLVLSTDTAPREIIAVVSVKGGADGNIGGFLGRNSADTGLRLNSSPGSWAADGATTLVNGVATTSYTAGTPHVVDRYGTTWTNWPAAGLGQYYSGGGRYFNGDVAEVLVYGATLSVADRASVLAYLNSKWRGIGGAVATATLPTNTAVNLAAGGVVLDLGGAHQIVGSLAGAAGSIVTNSGSLTVGGDHSTRTFSGALTGAGGFVKQGGGAFILNGSIAGPVAVNAGTLGGDGSVAGAATINGGATLSPGVLVGTLSFGGSLVLAAGSATFLEIDRAASTNDAVTVGGALTLGGTLTVARLGAAPFAAGDHFQLFNAASRGGSFAAMTLPPLTPGLTWNASRLSSQGQLWILSTNPPAITGATITGTGFAFHGSGFAFHGSGGTPGWSYYVLTTTNLTLPLSQWTVLDTNLFDTAGHFAWTNEVNVNVPQSFFRLQSQ